MPIQQLPLMKGVGKDFRNADYIDYLPVNMLATPKEILNSSGYLRSFPGIAKRSDVNGVSRGVEYNMAQNAVYRVCGGKLYKGESEVGDVAGSGRVSMAHGRTSQAVGVNGQLVEYRYDGTVKTVSNWPTDSGFTQYELGSVRDITRLRGRYAWSKDGTDSWFITDLEDESHPDRYSAQYRAESQPDGIIGIGTWRDFIVCFGSSTIEYFSLTGATTVGAALYVAQPSLMVQKGIAGTYCKTPFADSYAFISNPATGAPSVYIIGSGQVSQIASASIEKILRSYTADELADGVMESLRFDAHELLIIHLPRHVLVYDASSSANGPQWCVLKTGLYDDVYRAIDFIYEGNQITCGDKLESMTGKLQFTPLAEQYVNQLQNLSSLEGQGQALNQYYNSQQYKDLAGQARYQSLAAAEATGGLGSTATSNQLATIAPTLGQSWLSNQMSNYNNLANVGLGALQGQANAGQTYANNMSSIAQQSAALAAANANKPSSLQTAISGGTSGAIAGAGVASLLGTSTPWGAGIGAGIGLLGSLF